MKNRDGLENNDDWETPRWLYDELNAEFHFDFDPCPHHPDFNGLEIEWGQCNFINPPYNRRDKPKFIRKAFEEWQKGKTCVLLIPVATSTVQFHEMILPHAAEIRFLRGRVAFCGINTRGEYTTTHKGKHDSMIVVFRGRSNVQANTVRHLMISTIEPHRNGDQPCQHHRASRRTRRANRARPPRSYGA